MTSYTPIELHFENLSAATTASLTITSPGLTWSFGNDRLRGQGMVVAVDDAMPFTLAGLTIGRRMLQVALPNETSGAEGIDFSLSLYLESQNDPQFFEGFLNINESARVRFVIENQFRGSWYNGSFAAAWQQGI